MISLEFNKDKEMIELICDNEGIESLILTLKNLLKNGGHLHLMTPSWAGDDLSETPLDHDTEIIHHLKIILIPPGKSNNS